MKSSEALRKARFLIEDGTELGLCFAFAACGGRGTKAYRRISTVCYGEYIDSWLANNSGEFRVFAAANHPRSDSYLEAMRAYRLAWIEWLIPQYEAVGD